MAQILESPRWSNYIALALPPTRRRSMQLRSFALTVALALFAANSEAAQLYMSAGNSVYEFDSSGQLITSASDPNNVLFQGSVVGPDNRLYVGVSNGVGRVDSFSPDLSNHGTGFVSKNQVGIAL